MKIYTSYFAKLRKLPDNEYTSIAICGASPGWYDGLQYKKLAPSYSIWKEYKLDGGTEEEYIERFNNEILSKLNPEEIMSELINMAKTDKIVLLCYEKIGEFCHRHIVSKWLNDYGYDVKEIEI